MSAPVITAGDRLSLTLFLSLAVHALIALGVGFTWTQGSDRQPPPMIEITFADKPSEKAPDDHDFLAQANQDGGGESEEAAVPKKTPSAAPDNGTEDGAAEAAPQPEPAPPDEPTPEPRAEAERTAAKAEPAPDPEPRPEPELSPDAILDASREVAAEQALAEARRDVSARYPSKRRISARTKAHAAAAYMRQWVSKVEDIGNLNYPSEARQRQLSGRLVLEVTLRPDGTVHEIETLRPSPHPALDQAAKRIVDLASPFARIPEEVLDGNDMLVITRTWEFDNSRRFSAD